jgi:hypothetical protein
MNMRQVGVAALSCIVLAFVIKGYCILQHVDTTTDALLPYSMQTFENFLCLASVLIAVIVAPFVFKIKV